MTMPKGWRPEPSSYSDQPSYSYSTQQESSTPMTRLTPQNSQAFISYAREDEWAAMRLYHELKDAGLNPWIDRKNLLPGQRWEREIEKAIKNSAYFIPLFSSNSVQKLGYVQNEFSFALDVFEKFEHIAGFKVYYIPVRLDDCYVPYEKLRSIHITDMFPYEQNWKEGVQCIIQVVNQDVNTANNLFEYLRIAEQLSDSENYQQAIEWYDKALQIDSNSSILIDKGYCLKKLGRYNEAVLCYSMVIQRPYNNEALALAWSGIGDCMYSQARYQKAIECYVKSLELDEPQSGIWNAAGNALYFLGKYQEAIEYYTRSLEVDPSSGVVWYNKGNALNALNNYVAANQCYNKAKQLGYHGQ